MADRLIGNAYFNIYPNGDNFGPQAEAIVKKALAAIKPQVPVSPELNKAAAATVKAELKQLGTDVNVDAALSAASMVRIKSQLMSLAENLNLGADIDPAELAKIEAELKALSDQVKVNAAISPEQITAIEAQIDALMHPELKPTLSPEQLGIDKDELDAAFSGLTIDPVATPASLTRLRSELVSTLNDLDVSPVLSIPALAELRAELDTALANLPVTVDGASLAALRNLIDNYIGGQGVNFTKLIADPNAMAAMKEQIQAGLNALGAVDIPTQITTEDMAQNAASLQAYMRTGITAIEIPTTISKADMAENAAALQAYMRTGMTAIQVPTTISTADMAANAAALQAYMRSGMTAIQVPTTISPAQLAAMKSSLNAYMNANPVQLQVSTTTAMAKITALAAYAQQAMSNAFGNLGGLGTAIAKIAGLQAVSQGLISTWSKLNDLTNATNAIVGTSTSLWANFFQSAGGGWAALTSRITLFAGAFNAVLPEIASSVSVWHLATDWVVEFAAVLVPATVAVSAWGAVMAFVGADALTKFEAVATAATVTGEQIGSFNSKLQGGIGPLQKLQNYLNPTVWELYGDAINVADSKTGAFTNVVKAVNSVVEDLAARMTQAFSSNGFASFINQGAADFQRFGTIIGNLGGTFGDLIKDVPGYAQVIQEVLVVITQGIEEFTAFIGPVIKAGLALHGFILYTGLMVTAGVTMLAGIGNVTVKIFEFASAATDLDTIITTLYVSFDDALIAIKAFGTRLGLLITSPAVAAIVALGLAAYAIVTNFNTATTSVTNFINNMNTHLNSLGGGSALQQIVVDLGEVNNQIKAMSTPQMYQQVASNWSNLSNWGNEISKTFQVATSDITQGYDDITNPSVTTKIQGVQSVISGLWAAITGGHAQSVSLQLTDNIKALENEYNNLTSQEKNLLTVTGSLMTGQTGVTTSTFSWAQSLGILNAAGVAANDSLSTMETKVDGLIQGWNTLGLTGGQVGNAVNALTMDTQLGQTGVTKLTQAYSDYISTLTGGETAFTTFGEGLQTLATSLSSAGASGVTFTNSLGQFETTGSAAGATLNGLSQASLNARGAFSEEITNATTLYNSLLTLATVSNLGAKGQGTLAQAGKDMVATLLPLAKGSSTALAQLSGLAQIAGGPATTSFQALSKWVGNTKDPMKNLNQIEGDLTTSSVNLETDASNLAGAFGVTLTSAISNAIFVAEKGPQALQALANALVALKDGTGSVTQVTSALAQFIPALTVTTGSSKEAEDQFVALAGSIGISKTAADALWTSATTGANSLNDVTKAASGLTSAASANLNVFKMLPGYLTGSVNTYNTLVGTITETDTVLQSNKSNVNLAETAFINFAENGLDLSATAAKNLWDTQKAQNLTAMASNAKTTQSAFVNFAKSGLGLTTTQAQELWSTLRLQYLDTLATKAGSSESKFVALAKSGFGLTTSAAETLWSTLRAQYLDTLATKAGETESAFVNVAKKLGDTTTAAKNLWSALHNVAAGSPYNAEVKSVISASGEVKAIEQSAPGASLDQVLAYLQFGETGGTVKGPGPSGKDSTLVVAAPGELIIPTSHAPKFGDMARKASIPGFSSGGMVTAEPAIASAIKAIPGVGEQNDEAFGQAATQAFVTSLKDATESGMLPTVGAPVSASVQSVLKQALQATQTPLSWLPALETLVARESGGNASAIDPISVGGEHATGLLQTLPSTFSEYAMPGYASNIDNPLDNAIAAIRYIKAEYGSPANIVGIGRPGTYEGYSAGGMVSEPVFGYGAYSGMPYSFAENGPEQVIPGGASTATSSIMQPMTIYQGQNLISVLNQVANLLQQAPYAYAQALTQTNGAGVRRGAFATGG